MFQLWTASKLGKLSLALRKKITFFAPLTESLDYMGIDPASFVRVTPSARLGRDGLIHDVAANVPCFNFNGEIPLGVRVSPGESLNWSPANGLDNINTLIWFEDDVPKSTLTAAVPVSSAGYWVGTANAHVKYLTKADRMLTALEVAEIQKAFLDTPQEVIVPAPPAPATVDTGIFVTEIPAGTRNGTNTVFTLSNDPVLGSILLVAHGVVCRRVASAPGNMEYTLSGTGNRTVTMGMAPVASGPTAAPLFATYNRSGSQVGIFMKETPSGARNGSNTVFTLSRSAHPQSLLLACFGTALLQVVSNPGQMEYTLSGQTITLGMAPTTAYPFAAQYLAVP
jgi:hypothetical protein